MTDKNKLLHLIGVDRLLYFTDALVAIAATLLVLPLVDAAGVYVVEHPGTPGHPDTDGSAAGFLSSHADALLPFVISFLVIVRLWMGHHRLFTKIEKLTPAFLWITMAWVLSIVWLPVATAMSGAMSSDDLLVRTIYIGSMLLTSVLSLCSRLYMRGHPRMHSLDADGLRRGLAMDISMIALFSLSLVLAAAIPALSYYPLFLMLLTGPVERLFGRMLGAGPSRR